MTAPDKPDHANGSAEAPNILILISEAAICPPPFLFTADLTKAPIQTPAKGAYHREHLLFFCLQADPKRFPACHGLNVLPDHGPSNLAFYGAFGTVLPLVCLHPTRPRSAWPLAWGRNALARSTALHRCHGWAAPISLLVRGVAGHRVLFVFPSSPGSGIEYLRHK